MKFTRAVINGIPLGLLAWLLLAIATVAHAQAPQGCGNATPTQTLTHPFSNTGSSATLTLLSSAVTGTKMAHICAINIGPVAGAVNVALIEGTRTTNPCDTSTLGLAGGATAATGWQFATNGGLTYGNGRGVVAQTTVAGNAVCLAFSAGVQVSGVITYALY